MEYLLGKTRALELREELKENLSKLDRSLKLVCLRKELFFTNTEISHPYISFFSLQFGLISNKVVQNLPQRKLYFCSA